MLCQFSRRYPLASSIVIPSTPGLPLLLRTRFHALSRFPRSHTSSINCSTQAGLSGTGFATSGPLVTANRGFTPVFWYQGQRVLELLPLSTHELPFLLATLGRSGLRSSFRLGLSVAPPFGLRSASLASPTA